MWTVSVKAAQSELNESRTSPERTPHGRRHERTYHQVTFLILYIDYDPETLEKWCLSETLGTLYIRRTNFRLTVFHKSINSHLALSFGYILQPVLRLTRNLNSEAFNTITQKKDTNYFPAQ